MMNLSNSTPVLYIKSHIFNSSESAVKLAEKKHTLANIHFAQTLLAIKNSQTINNKFNKQIDYNGEKISRDEKYNKISSRINDLCLREMENQFADIEQATESFKYNNPDNSRFKNVGTAAETQIHTSKGVAMPANQITINDKELAMRCQYPKTEHMEDHLQMIMDRKIPVVVVLSSSDDIKKRSLPVYFNHPETTLGEISVTSYIKKDRNTRDASVTMCGKLKLNHYQIDMTSKNDRLRTSVIHVTNWPDFASVSVEDIKALASFVKHKVEEKHAGNTSTCAQPLIHCSAGSGRTGVLIGALALMDETNKSSAKDIVLDMRKSGTNMMVQTKDQYKTLVDLENERLLDLKN